MLFDGNEHKIIIRRKRSIVFLSLLSSLGHDAYNGLVFRCMASRSFCCMCDRVCCRLECAQPRLCCYYCYYCYYWMLFVFTSHSTAHLPTDLRILQTRTHTHEGSIHCVVHNIICSIHNADKNTFTQRW